MPRYDKGTAILTKMIRYCEEIDLLTERFGKSYTAFEGDFAYQYACAMCIVQIGELASHLPEEFRATHNKVPWTQIRGIRNLFVHGYEKTDLLRTWNTIETDVPALKVYCASVLKSMEDIDTSVV
ncbi:hypothetical protein R80B4_00271 [Fibrobacteres bacterium R8-0-B4]